jgi:hypothetical protein
MFNKSRTYKHNDPLYRIKQGKVFNNNNKEAFANHYDERSKQDELAAQNESGLSDQEMSIIMAATDRDWETFPCFILYRGSLCL